MHTQIDKATKFYTTREEKKTFSFRNFVAGVNCYERTFNRDSKLYHWGVFSLDQKIYKKNIRE